MLDKQRLRSFLLGGLTGVIAGILLAPRSGRETRGTIRDRAGEARERSRESYFDARENVRERFSASSDSASAGTAFGDFGAFDLSEPLADAPERDPEVPESEVHKRPVLRDVSRETPDGGHDDDEGAGRAEELRRKVRETRDNLRARSRGPVEKGNRGGEGEE